MRNGNFKMAINSLRRSRGRSLLTMFGIIIGVIAVVITLSIGGGVKRQITDQLNHLGNDVITVRPGASDQDTDYAAAGGVFAGLGSGPLTTADWNIVRQTTGVSSSVPLGVGSGFAAVEGRKLAGNSVVATTNSLPEILNQKVEHGVFFDEQELNSKVVVIGVRVAEDLFDENAPIGRTLSIRGEDFIVRGVFEEFSGNPLSLGTDLNKAVFIPLPVANDLSGGAVPIAQIFARSAQAVSPATVSTAISRNLAKSHAGQQDFTVLTKTQALQANSSSVTLITQLISGIAALSLLVGGIGIVNIMLVSVTERTREIGIRKAIGATNRQILSQFLIEAATLSAAGGLIGVLLALLAIFVIRVSTNLHPIISIPLLVAVPVVAWLVGVVFGVAPAVAAARKDPIEALRYE
ncbi:MAG: ABC transporter permease [Candidatus Saccharimonadales bacterium]